MTVEQPDHPTDYRMVKLVDGTLLVGTISVDESFLRIENPLQLTTVQRMTEFGMKDDSSLAPWIPFCNEEKFNIPKDKIIVISIAARELANYYEVVLNKYKTQQNRAPLTPEEMKHILEVAEEMEGKKQDYEADDEFNGYKFTSKKVN